jgi:hypothetical protein
MKKFAILLVSLVMATSLFSQERAPKEIDPERMTERMKSELDLTEEQYPLVYEANKTMILNVREAGGREADPEKLKEIRANHVAELEKVLTEEQMEKLKENHEERKRRMKERRRERQH